jgi:predicted RNase H-like HicB family nuclease
MRYAIVIEKAENNCSAYVPDLPGCVATGGTVEEVESQIREAIAFHLDGLREDGISLPEPSSVVEYLEIAADDQGDPAYGCVAVFDARDGG